MNKIKLSLTICFLINFGCMYPFINRYKKPLLLGGITSLVGISAFKLDEQLRKEEENKRKKKEQEIIFQDPFVQRVLTTGNPLLISLVGQLKRRQIDRTDIFSLNNIENRELFFVDRDNLKSKLEAVGLSHFIEKTAIVDKLLVGGHFNEKDLNALVDQSLEKYFKNLSSWPEDWQKDLKEIMQQRKEHILEVIVNSSSRK